MLGNNPIRPPVQGDGNILDVQDIFATLQGEGPYAGWPSVFIRLGGCNLACRFCDTEFESFTPWILDHILLRTDELSGGASGRRSHNLIVITGGEPLRQPIEKLCQKLIEKNYKVQIETNGTLFRELASEVDIICSPKNTNTGYHAIREDLLKRINAFKFLISASKETYSQVVEIGQGKYNIPVYVQPMDEQDEIKNQKNLELAMQLVQEQGYRLSLQLHKLLGIK